MTALHEVIEVPTAPAEAFAYVSDFTTTAQWDPGVVSCTRTSGDGGVGTTYALEATFRGKTVPFSYVVTALEPGRRIVLHGEGARATSDDAITFEPTAEGGTRITYAAEIRFKGLLRVAEPLLARTFRSLGEKALAGLRAALTPREA